jgi:hypothetical protein
MLGVTAAFSTNGQQWRTVTTPWEAPAMSTGAIATFGTPAALAYGNGMFLSVGQWFDVAADGKQIATAIAARSRDGITGRRSISAPLSVLRIRSSWFASVIAG